MVLAQLHHVAAHSAHYAGDLPRAASELERALAMSISRTDLDFYLDILQSLAFFAAMAGRHERSKACYEEIIQLTGPRGESLHRASALLALGLDAWRRGDPVSAVELQRSALEIKIGLDDRLGTAVGLEALAWGLARWGSTSVPPTCWAPQKRCGTPPAARLRPCFRNWPLITMSRWPPPAPRSAIRGMRPRFSGAGRCRSPRR
jgi:tetratricopeptide (TPR) repeat protein